MIKLLKINNIKNHIIKILIFNIIFIHNICFAQTTKVYQCWIAKGTPNVFQWYNIDAPIPDILKVKEEHRSKFNIPIIICFDNINGYVTGSKLFLMNANPIEQNPFGYSFFGHNDIEVNNITFGNVIYIYSIDLINMKLMIAENTMLDFNSYKKYMDDNLNLLLKENNNLSDNDKEKTKKIIDDMKDGILKNGTLTTHMEVWDVEKIQ